MNKCILVLGISSILSFSAISDARADCSDGLILCGGECWHPMDVVAKTAHCDESTGNLVADTCMNSSSIICQGICMPPEYAALYGCTNSTPTCPNGLIFCGGSCKDPITVSAKTAHCNESTGNLIPDSCYGSLDIICGGRCKDPMMVNASVAHCDESTGNLVPDTCENGFFMCGDRCNYLGSYTNSAHCDESTGNVVADSCKNYSILTNGDCEPCGGGHSPNSAGTKCVADCGWKYGPCSECDYDEDEEPIACTKCDYGYKSKNGSCLWGNPGDSCGEGYVDGDGVCYEIPDGCSSVSAANGSCTKCSSGYSLDDDNNCVECNKPGFKNVSGYCNRVQYTPAEAAAILKDDNNSVTITFKK